ncbi:MAG: diaminopimelate epimerase [Bacteroidota bacterium]|nr:diaminopimelate epimerase [Bacteroidota bacterium]
MKIAFYKYQGTGNDFIILDGLNVTPELSRLQIRWLCDRHFGIGADGLMILQHDPELDFSMKYFNSDGNESTMCGNGGRCMVAFAHSLKLFNGKETRFHAIDGNHFAQIIDKQDNKANVRLKMKDVEAEPGEEGHFFLNTGSPHYIIISTGVDKIDIVKEARKIRYGTCFAEEGTNVDFMEIFSDHLFVRTYERGVEDETLSCGTGVTASAIAAALINPDNKGFFRIRTRGGELSVSFHQDSMKFTDVFLEGPATFVFSGEITLP